MVALNHHIETRHDPIRFDHDRVVWDPDYRREVIELLKRDEASEQADS